MEPSVPVNLSIKNAPDDVVQQLRERAARNHRSLQGELMAIIEEAVRPGARLTPHEVPGRDPQTRPEIAERGSRDGSGGS